MLLETFYFLKCIFIFLLEKHKNPHCQVQALALLRSLVLAHTLSDPPTHCLAPLSAPAMLAKLLLIHCFAIHCHSQISVPIYQRLKSSLEFQFCHFIPSFWSEDP